MALEPILLPNRDLGWVESGWMRLGYPELPDQAGQEPPPWGSAGPMVELVKSLQELCRVNPLSYLGKTLRLQANCFPPLLSRK